MLLYKQILGGILYEQDAHHLMVGFFLPFQCGELKMATEKVPPGLAIAPGKPS